jgi:hypothetical protein
MSEAEPLTEEQRISLLENKVGKNRTVIMVLALTLIMVLSVSCTILIFKLFNVDEPYVSRSKFEQQVEVLETLKEEVKQQQLLIEHLTLTYETSQIASFQTTLIEQEQSYQTFLATMRLGMFDLAKMVQGSRTWLDIYNDKLEDAEDLSEAREKALNKIVLKSLK